MAQTVKHLSAMQDPRVRSLGWEDPLEKEMAAHSSILAWKIPWTAEPGRLPSTGSQRVGHDRATSLPALQADPLPAELKNSKDSGTILLSPNMTHLSLVQLKTSPHLKSLYPPLGDSHSFSNSHTPL